MFAPVLESRLAGAPHWAGRDFVGGDPDVLLVGRNFGCIQTRDPMDRLFERPDKLIAQFFALFSPKYNKWPKIYIYFSYKGRQGHYNTKLFAPI
jgi:hypothetical protein